MKKWLIAIVVGIVVGGTLIATGFHVRVTWYHTRAPVVSEDAKAILHGIDLQHRKKIYLAFLEGRERSGGIVGDPNDGGSFGGLGQRSGGIVEQHGASGGWDNQDETSTDRWGVDIDIGWDRGPIGRIGGHFEHEHSVSKEGYDRDHD